MESDIFIYIVLKILLLITIILFILRIRYRGDDGKSHISDTDKNIRNRILRYVETTEYETSHEEKIGNQTRKEQLLQKIEKEQPPAYALQATEKGLELLSDLATFLTKEIEEKIPTTFKEFVENKGYKMSDMKSTHPEYNRLFQEFQNITEPLKIGESLPIEPTYTKLPEDFLNKGRIKEVKPTEIPTEVADNYTKVKKYFKPIITTPTAMPDKEDDEKYCAYLDIETTSLNPRDGDLTVIGLYLENDHKQKVIQLVGDEISSSKLIEIMEKVKVFYTYNGKRFDLPYIKTKLGIELTDYCIHNDLMYECWQRNLKGGFKEVERKLGIRRKLSEIDGRVAVQLWHNYKFYGDKESLRTLLEYNKEDVLNLKALREKLKI